MGRSVDDRVVRMQFDNARFEQNAKQSMSTIDALKQKLDFSGSAKGLTSLQKSANSFDMSSVGSAIGTVQAKFSALQVVGMTVISNLTNSAIGMLKRITSNTLGLIRTGGLNRAMNIEAAKFSLQGLGIAWKDAYESIDFGVTNTAYGLDAAAKAAAQLSASGVDLYKKIEVSSVDAANGNKVVTRETTKMGQSLKAISAVAAQTNSDFQSIADIFTTVAGQGKVMGMQMQQLATRGMNPYTVLGEKLGKSEAQIRELVSKGKIDFDTFMDAMYYKFAENAGKANETLTGVTSNIRAALSKIGALFFSPLVENGGALVKMLDAIRAKLNEFKTVLDESGFDDQFAVFQKDFFSKIAKAIQGIDIASFSSAFVHIAKGIVNIFKPILGIFKAIGNGFRDAFPPKSMSDINGMAEGFEKLTSKLVLGQRAAERIQMVFRNFFNIIKNAKNIFMQMFPVDMTKIINHVVTSFNKFASSLTYNHKAVTNFAKLFRGLFSLFDSFYTIVKTVITSLFPNLDKFFGDTLSNAGSTVIDLAGAIGEALLKFNEFVHKVVESEHPLKTIFGTLGSVFSVLKSIFADIFSVGKSVFGDLFKSLLSLVEPMVAILKKFVDALKTVLDSIAAGEKIDWKKALGIAGGTVALTYFWKRITWFMGRFKRFRENLVQLAETGFTAVADTFTSLKNVAGNIIGIPLKLGRAFQGFANEKNASAILKLAAAVGILALSMVALSTIEPEKLSRSLSAVIILVVSLAAAASFLINSFSQFGKLKYAIVDWTDVVKNAFTSLQLFMKLKGLGSILLRLAAGVAILAVSVIALSKLDLPSLAKGIGAVAVLLTALTVAASKLTTKLDRFQTATIAAMLISFSVAIAILGLTVKSFSKLNPEGLLQGLIGVAGLIAAITLMLNHLKSGATKGIVALGIGLIAFAVGVRVLATAVNAFAGMDDVALLQGLLAVFSVMAAVTLMTNHMDGGGKMLAIAAGMLIVSAAMKVMSSAVMSLASLDLTSLLTGIGGLLAILFGVGVALTYMQANILGAAALLVAAGAIAIFTVAIMGLSKVDGVGKTLLVLAGGLLVLFAATAVAGIVAPLVLLFSAALVALGVSLAISGAAMGLFAVEFTALSMILSVGAKAMISGLTTLVTGLIKIATDVGRAVAVAITSFLETMATKLPVMTQFFATAITALLDALSEAIPKVVDAGVNLVLSLINGIASNVGRIISVAAEFITNFLTGLAEKIPMIIQAGVDLTLSFINGMANGIRDNTDQVISAVGNLISAVIEAALSLMQYLVEDIPIVGDKMAAGLETAKEKVRDVLAYDSMSTIGDDAISGITDSIASSAEGASSAGEAVGDSVKTGIEDSLVGIDTSGINDQLTAGFEIVDMQKVGADLGLDFVGGLGETDVATVGEQLGLSGSDAASATAPQFESAGKNAGSGFVSGIRSYYSTAGAVGGTLGTTSLAGLKSALGIHSPSREYGEAGKFSVLGYVNFIKKYAYLASNASAKMGEDSVEALRESCAKVANAANSDNTFTITPILDMSVMEEQMRAFNSNVGTRTIALTKSVNFTNQNGIVQHLDELTQAVNKLSDSQNSETMSRMYGLMESYFPEFTKDVVLDGRKISRQTAPYMTEDIDTINRFNNLLAGVK